MKNIQIMGILNITPDSFSDGGLYFSDSQKAVSRAREMLNEGADIIDVGGESTRPGSESISEKEELKRIIPVIQAIKKNLGDSIQISIDTNKSFVAKQAIDCGVTIINSLGGMKFDERLGDVVSASGCRFIIYHIKGLPRTMQTGQITYIDVIEEISQFFDQQIMFGKSKGIKKEQFILDPGIGFGKTIEQNIEIIKRFHEFKKYNLPLLIGVSRKSHLGNLLQQKLQLATPPSPLERLEASLAETAVAIENGASIVRTHDVGQTKKFITVLEELI